jgi:hypothetical protein
MRQWRDIGAGIDFDAGLTGPSSLLNLRLLPKRRKVALPEEIGQGAGS